MHRSVTFVGRGVRDAWLETIIMPSNFKRLVRERQAKTGESYQTAARHVRAQGEARVSVPSSEMAPVAKMVLEDHGSIAAGATLSEVPLTTLPQDDELEADDAVAVLKVYWPIGQQVEKAASDWATCHDQMIGFHAMRIGLSEILASTRQAAAQIPREKIARLPCGVEIEDAHRSYVDTQVDHLARLSEWLERNTDALEPMMRDRPLTEAWPAIADPRPIDTSYGYYQVMKVERTKSLFQCGPANNVAWINKVAARLGLGPDKPGGGLLLVRSSQRVIAR